MHLQCISSLHSGYTIPTYCFTRQHRAFPLASIGRAPLGQCPWCTLLSQPPSAYLAGSVSAAAVGSPKDGPVNSLCQPSGTNASTTELLPILLKEQNHDELSGSEPLSNCASGIFCADGSNVTLPYRLQLATGFRVRKAVIKFTLLPDGNISAEVTTDLSLLTEVIKQLSFRQFCCVDGVSNAVKCFMPELKCETPLHACVHG